MVERVTPPQPQPRIRTFYRKYKLPGIIGKGLTEIEADVKKGLLKLSKIGPRSVGAYEDDLAEYQRRLQEKYGS